MVTVAVYASPYEAGMAKSELESFGIPVFVADEFTIGAYNLYSNALGGVKVNVPASYVEKARQILSAELSIEESQELSAGDKVNTHKEIAKSFVWLYFGLSAISLATLIYVIMTQE